MNSSGCYKMSLPWKFDILIDRQFFVKLSLENMLQMMGQSVLEFWSLNRMKTKSIWASLPDLWTSMWLNSFITRLTDSARRPTGSMWQPRAEAGNVRQVLLFCGNSSRCVIRMATIMIMWCDAHDKRWIHTPRWPPPHPPTPCPPVW